MEPRTILTTKDKRTCVELRCFPLYGEIAETGDASADVQLAEIIAEIQAMYQLPSGALELAFLSIRLVCQFLLSFRDGQCGSKMKSGYLGGTFKRTFS